MYIYHSEEREHRKHREYFYNESSKRLNFLVCVHLRQSPNLELKSTQGSRT